MDRDDQATQHHLHRLHDEQELQTGDPKITTHHSQGPHLQFGNGHSSAETGQPLIIQPPAFTSVSRASDDAYHSANMYAIPTSVEPVARSRNEDSDFFECLTQLFAGEINDGAPTQMISNPQYVTDPLAWLPQESRTLERTGIPLPVEVDVPPTTAPISTDVGARSKSTNTKLPPIKAATGKVKASSKYRRQTKKGSAQLAPFDYLKNMLAERGYSFATIKSTEAGYLTDPSPLQLASFGSALVNAVHTSDVTLLSSLLGCGLSPNPCNQFRDSSLDWACRKANEAVFRCFLEHNADLRVCDGFGRTPLHHAAWADVFSPTIASCILQRDPVQLFFEENTGRTPLEYIPSKLTTNWIAFLDNHKEDLFPIHGPPLAVTKRQLSQLPDPPNAISVDLAKLVSSGKIQPKQVVAMDEITRETWMMP